MRIICPNCRSEYEFDGTRVSSRGTKVKCSSCDHVFTIYRVEEPASLDAPKLRERSRRKIGKLAGQRLFLRQEGKTYKVQGVGLLQRWIVEKRVLATDEVSLDGEEWDLVSRLSELRPFFAVLRQLRETRRELLSTRNRLKETLEMRAVGEAPDVHDTSDVMAHAPQSLVDEEPPVRLSDTTVTAEDGPPPHTEQSLDRHMLVPPYFGEGDDENPDDLVEPRTAELHTRPPDPISPEIVGTGDFPAAAVKDTIETREEPFPPDVLGDEMYVSAEPDVRPPVEEESPPGAPDEGEPVGSDDSGAYGADVTREEVSPIADGAPAGDPIPSVAREAVSKLAAEEAAPPEYDPAAQSVFSEPVEARTSFEDPDGPADETVESPPAIDFESAIGPVEDGPEESEEHLSEEPQEDLPEQVAPSRDSIEVSGEDAAAEPPQEASRDSVGSGEESSALDQPAIDFDSALGPMEDSEESSDDYKDDPPPIDFGDTADSVVEDEGDEGLGKDFDTFESSYEQAFSTADSEDEEWEGDDFAQRYDSYGDEAAGSGVTWPYIVGAAALIAVIAGGAWFAVHKMKSDTRSLDDFGTTEPSAETDGTGESATTDPELDEDALADNAAEDTEEETATAVEPTAADLAEEAPQPDPERVTPEAVEETTPEEIVEEPPTPEESPTPKPDPDAIDWGDTGAAAAEPAPPANADHGALATQLAAEGRHGEAIQEYLRAFLSDPNNAGLRKGAGWAYIEIGNNAEAAKHFRKAILLNSMDPETHYGLGLAYEGMGNNDQAIDEYQTYLGLAPNGREAMEVQILLRRLVEMSGG